MQYSLKKFLVALAIGRVIRYTILGFLAAHYGRQLLGVMGRNTIGVVVAAVLIVAAGAALVFLIRSGHKASGQKSSVH
jgi:sulfite exporter TauE/SafE